MLRVVGRAKFIVTAGIRPDEEPGEEKVMEFFEKVRSYVLSHKLLKDG